MGTTCSPAERMSPTTAQQDVRGRQVLLCVGTSLSFMLETSSRCPMHYGPHALDMHVKCMQGPSSGQCPMGSGQCPMGQLA